MNRNWKPALRYGLRDYLMGSWPFLAVIVALVIASFAGTFLFNGERISFSGYGMTAAICLFVFGVVEPRPCLRLCAQMGVSRGTAFLSNLLAAVATAAWLSAAGEVLLTAAGALADGTGLTFPDLYQLLYVGQNVDVTLVPAMTLPQHLNSILFNTGLLCAAYAFGMFFTFLFWRLSKLWTVAAAISIPVVLNAVPVVIYRRPAARALWDRFSWWVCDSMWNLLGVFALLAAVLTGIAWLLVRRANIKAPSGK